MTERCVVSNHCDETCDWIETIDGWETDCGLMIVTLHQTPEETGLVACWHCGRRIESFYGTELALKPAGVE